MLQASSVLPLLKQQGYHVTFMTTPQGKEIVEQNPFIDQWFIQDTDQVPNPWLTEFWRVHRTKYDRWINLSESVEGTYLALPGRAQHQWSHDARRQLLDHNYLETTHLIAGVPYDPSCKFYPTAKEVEWAQRDRKAMTADKVVLWVLTGSSVHKVWPYVDTIVARLMLYHPSVKVVFSGDELSELGEAGWENESRVVRRCGKWSIRETLVFANTQADLVIGPETGVLNSVAFSKIPKIVFLSHSSKNNLTRDWKNAVALEPDGCSCFPCHILHYGFEYCRRDEATGVADCQAKISADVVWDSINRLLRS
jgi:ADP-heptose:LPS heptosyltransferase